MTARPTRPTLNDVQHMTPEQVADLPLSQIQALMSDLSDEKARIGSIDAIIHAAMEDRFGLRARAEIQTGTVRVDDEDGLAVKVDIPKRVEWDQKQLELVASDIRNTWGEDPEDYMRVKRDVTETAYKNWPQALKRIVEPARTVKAGKPKFSIEQKGQE